MDDVFDEHRFRASFPLGTEGYSLVNAEHIQLLLSATAEDATSATPGALTSHHPIPIPTNIPSHLLIPPTPLPQSLGGSVTSNVLRHVPPPQSTPIYPKKVEDLSTSLRDTAAELLQSIISQLNDPNGDASLGIDLSDLPTDQAGLDKFLGEFVAALNSEEDQSTNNVEGSTHGENQTGHGVGGQLYNHSTGFTSLNGYAAPNRQAAVQDAEAKRAEKAKVRQENRERKKRWREFNADRNKDNDLRCRVVKRATKIFGPQQTSRKKAWVEDEFQKRKHKREAKERARNQDPYAPFPEFARAPLPPHQPPQTPQQNSISAELRPVQNDPALLSAIETLAAVARSAEAPNLNATELVKLIISDPTHLELFSTLIRENQQKRSGVHNVAPNPPNSYHSFNVPPTTPTSSNGYQSNLGQTNQYLEFNNHPITANSSRSNSIQDTPSPTSSSFSDMMGTPTRVHIGTAPSTPIIMQNQALLLPSTPLQSTLTPQFDTPTTTTGTTPAPTPVPVPMPVHMQQPVEVSSPPRAPRAPMAPVAPVAPMAPTAPGTAPTAPIRAMSAPRAPMAPMAPVAPMAPTVPRVVAPEANKWSFASASKEANILLPSALPMPAPVPPVSPMGSTPAAAVAPTVAPVTPTPSANEASPAAATAPVAPLTPSPTITEASKPADSLQEAIDLTGPEIDEVKELKELKELNEDKENKENKEVREVREVKEVVEITQPVTAPMVASIPTPNEQAPIVSTTEPVVALELTEEKIQSPRPITEHSEPTPSTESPPVPTPSVDSQTPVETTTVSPVLGTEAPVTAPIEMTPATEQQVQEVQSLQALPERLPHEHDHPIFDFDKIDKNTDEENRALDKIIAEFEAGHHDVDMGELHHDMGEVHHDMGEVHHDTGEADHDMGVVYHDMGEVNHGMGDDLHLDPQQESPQEIQHELHHQPQQENPSNIMISHPMTADNYEDVEMGNAEDVLPAQESVHVEAVTEQATEVPTEQAVPQPETQPTTMPETQPETQTEAQPVPEPTAQPATQDEEHHESPLVQSSIESHSEIQPPTQAEVQPEAEPAAEPQPTAEPTAQLMATPVERPAPAPANKTVIEGLEGFPDLEGMELDEETLEMLKTAMADDTMLAELVDMLKDNSASNEEGDQNQMNGLMEAQSRQDFTDALNTETVNSTALNTGMQTPIDNNIVTDFDAFEKQLAEIDFDNLDGDGEGITLDQDTINELLEELKGMEGGNSNNNIVNNMGNNDGIQHLDQHMDMHMDHNMDSQMDHNMGLDDIDLDVNELTQNLTDEDLAALLSDEMLLNLTPSELSALGQNIQYEQQQAQEAQARGLAAATIEGQLEGIAKDLSLDEATHHALRQLVQALEHNPSLIQRCINGELDLSALSGAGNKRGWDGHGEQSMSKRTNMAPIPNMSGLSAQQRMSSNIPPRPPYSTASRSAKADEDVQAYKASFGNSAAMNRRLMAPPAFRTPSITYGFSTSIPPKKKTDENKVKSMGFPPMLAGLKKPAPPTPQCT